MTTSVDRGLTRATLRASGGEAPRGPAGPARRPRRRDGDERTYEAWLAEQTERLDPLMAFLGILFTLIVAFQFAEPGLSRFWTSALDVTTWVL